MSRENEYEHPKNVCTGNCAGMAWSRISYSGFACVLHEIVSQHFSNISHAHEGSGVAAIELLNEGTNCIGALVTRGHRLDL